MRLIYPGPSSDGPPDLARLYAYPAPAGVAVAGPGRPWVRANMIESADGAAAVDGLSGGLGGPADREVFGLLRALAGVILVGAGTARRRARCWRRHRPGPAPSSSRRSPRPRPAGRTWPGTPT